MVEVIKPPFSISERRKGTKTIFLAGSIDMGNAIDWQTSVTDQLIKSGRNLTLFNPRRPDWNKDWKQGVEEPQFYQQVNWELNALDKADVIILYITKDSKAPITLLELGLYASSGKVHVVVEEGFYRKGNVDVVCNKYDIPQYKNIQDLVMNIKL